MSEDGLQIVSTQLSKVISNCRFDFFQEESMAVHKEWSGMEGLELVPEMRVTL
jgi:hypothetical protein